METIRVYVNDYRKSLRKELDAKSDDELIFLLSEMGYSPLKSRKDNITCLVNNAVACLPLGSMVLESMVVIRQLSAYYGSEAIAKRKIKKNPEFFANVIHNK